MNLNPRLVAIQGIGFTPIQIAIQGLLEYLQTADTGWDTSQGVAGKNKPEERNYLAENLNREYERKSRIERANKLATEFIMMLVQTEILDG